MIRSRGRRPSRRAARAAGQAALVVACWAGPTVLLAAPQAAGEQRGGWLDQELRRFRTYPHLERAHRLIEAGRLAEARAELEEGLRIDPGEVETRRAYVVLLRRLGDHAGVVAQADLLLRGDPRSSVAWLYRGLARQDLGQPAAAFEDLRTASTLPGLSPSERQVTLSALADLALRLGRPAEALGFLDELPQDRRAYGEHVLRGAALAGLGRHAEAASAYRDAANLAPGLEERLSARREMAEALARQGDLVGAREAARAALALAPGDARLLAALGEYASRLGDDAAAVGWLKQALASPRLSEADERGRVLLSLGHAYRRLGDAAMAEKAFLDAAGLGGDLRSRGLSEAAQVVLTDGDAERALRHLEGAVRATSDRAGRARLHQQIGEVLLASGRAPEAIASFERSLAVVDDPETWAALALAQSACGRSDDALASYRRALARMTGRPARGEEILVKMAQIEARRGREAEAGALFLEAFARRRSPAALVGAAESYAKAGRWREAKDANRRLLELRDLPASARTEAWKRLAYARVGSGELEAAAEAFEKALGAGGDDGQTRQDLGILLYRLDRFAEAIPHLRRANELRPAPVNLVYVGRCEKGRGKLGLAILSLEEALAGGEGLEPATRKAVHAELGYLYAQIHEYERAARAFEASLAMGEDPVIAGRLGRMQRLLGRFQEAQRTLEAVPVTSLPPREAAEVLDELAGVQEAEHDPAAASETRERARALAPSAERDYRLALLKRDGGDLAGALLLFEAAVAADPGNSGYRVAFAYACERAGRLEDAARLFEDVVSREPGYPGLYEDLAYNRMRAARNEDATRWFERAIDDASLYPPASSDALAEQARTAYRLRREVSKLEDRWAVGAYLGLASQPLSGVSEGFGGAIADSQGGVDLAFRPPRIGFRADRIFQVFGRLLGTSLSSNDPLRPSVRQAGLGLRYKPFGRQNLYLWVERLFGLTDDVGDTWLVRGLFSWDRGYEMRPARPRWWYTYVLADVARFSGARGTLLYGEARQGMSWNHGDRLLLTPHLLVEGRRRVADATDGTLTLGAGASVRFLFDDDRYHAHRSSVELRAYYKLGRSWTAGETGDQNGWLFVGSVAF